MTSALRRLMFNPTVGRHAAFYVVAAPAPREPELGQSPRLSSVERAAHSALSAIR